MDTNILEFESLLGYMVKHGSEIELLEKVYCDYCRQIGVRKVARYDGRTKLGLWAYMCKDHFEKFGVGLGPGNGQLIVYHFIEDDGG